MYAFDPALCYLAAAAAAVGFGGNARTAAAVSGAGWVVSTAVAARASGLRPAGATILTTLVLTTVAGVVAAAIHLVGFELGLVTTVLMWVALVAGVVRMPTNLMQTYESWELELRSRWRRAMKPVTGWLPPPGGAPFVSIQVSTYASGGGL